LADIYTIRTKALTCGFLITEDGRGEKKKEGIPSSYRARSNIEGKEREREREGHRHGR
jgi:hypothetical protein